jgi:hypothetical protein
MRRVTRADRVIEMWKRMYIDGLWTLAEFEAHLAAMLPVIPPEWYDAP